MALSMTLSRVGQIMELYIDPLALDTCTTNVSTHNIYLIDIDLKMLRYETSNKDIIAAVCVLCIWNCCYSRKICGLRNSRYTQCYLGCMSVSGVDGDPRASVVSMPTVPVIDLTRNNYPIYMYCSGPSRPLWFHNGSLMAEDCNKALSVNDDFVCRFKVHIASPKRSHAGVYRCQDYRNASLQAEIYVQSKQNVIACSEIE